MIQKIELQFLFFLIFICSNLFAQNNSKHTFNKKDVQVYVDIAPLFFAAPAFTLGAGIEYNRFQFGILGIRGNKLPDSFKGIVFNNAKEVEFDKIASTEIVFKTFYKKTRKGLYVGGLANFSNFRAIDKTSNTNKVVSALNMDGFAGYRWFPFKKYFYIDPAFGFTTNVNKKVDINFANKTFQFKSGYDFGLFLFVGARFPLFKQNAQQTK